MFAMFKQKSKINLGFWASLPKPFTGLAPMWDVTDVVFREIVRSTSRPDVFFTEFVNTTALQSEGREAALKILRKKPEDSPIVAQIWGTNPKHFALAAKDITDMGFDGIDLNMGCPDRAVLKQGACASLIENHSLAEELIRATKENTTLPVSVKTRVGIKTPVLSEWLGFLLNQNLAAITIHARTVKEQSLVPANWEYIKLAVEHRNSKNLETLIIGNGDVSSYEDVLNRHKGTNCEGVMIGRGIFKDPWVFEKTLNPSQHSIQERLDLLISHTNLFVETWGESKNFNILKRFFKIYVNGFPGASDLRFKLMQASKKEEVYNIVSQFKITL